VFIPLLQGHYSKHHEVYMFKTLTGENTSPSTQFQV